MSTQFSKEQIAQLKGLFYEQELAIRTYFDHKFEINEERLDTIETKLDRLFTMENEDVIALNESITSHDRRLTKLEKVTKR